MPDITMCVGKLTAGGSTVVCPMAARCRRYTATPSPRRQSYFSDLPLRHDGSCSHFWPAEQPATPPRQGEGGAT